MTFSNKRVEAYYKLYAKLINFSNLSWWIIDLEDDPDIFYCNEIMCETFSLDKHLKRHSVRITCPIAGEYNSNVAIKSSAAAKKIFEEYHQLCMGEIEEYSNTFPYFDEDKNETMYFSSRAQALVRGDQGNAAVLFGIIEPELRCNELYIKAKYDSLTGIHNRREFDEKLEFLINLAVRDQKKVSVIMCDIDNFKLYNDHLGHYAGDECLMRVAGSIADTCIRSTDVPYRYGGEEFAIIVYGGRREAYHLAEAIRRGVYEMNIPHPAINNAPVTLSIGVTSVLPDQNTTAKRIIERADSALYSAKENGRNKSIHFKLSTPHISPV